MLSSHFYCQKSIWPLGDNSQKSQRAISGDIAKKKSESSERNVLALSFRHLEWKSDESTKHYLTKMLLAINWRYWQGVKNLRIRIKDQGRLMQMRFIEIHQTFENKKFGYFSNIIVFTAAKTLILITMVHWKPTQKNWKRLLSRRLHLSIGCAYGHGTSFILLDVAMFG